MQPPGNRLLQAVPPEVRARLDAHLTPVRLPMGKVLLQPDAPVSQAYFPLDGVVALLMVMADGTPIEVATVGNEGFVSIDALLSAARTPYRATCQTDVAALRVEIGPLRALFAESEHLRVLFLRYGAVVFSCTARALACKSEHSTAQRLARWLLMTRDRLAADAIPYTQEALAGMLGVQRQAVALAAEALKHVGAIDYRRGTVVVTDGGALEAAACEDYRAYRDAYEALLGPISAPNA